MSGMASRSLVRSLRHWSRQRDAASTVSWLPIVPASLVGVVTFRSLSYVFYRDTVWVRPFDRRILARSGRCSGATRNWTRWRGTAASWVSGPQPLRRDAHARIE